MGEQQHFLKYLYEEEKEFVICNVVLENQER